MKRFIGGILGLLSGCLASLAGEYELVVHFGDPAEVVDRTPTDQRFYHGPGHPHAESFRFPLREFSITALRNVQIPGFASPTNGLWLRRNRNWINEGPNLGPPLEGSEKFVLFLLTTHTDLFPKGAPLFVPQTYPLSEGARLSYDYVNQSFGGGGGGFGGGGQVFADVLAYDVRIISFELVPIAESSPPKLFASLAQNGQLTLNWGSDAFRGYEVQQSDSPLGPWTAIHVTSGGNAGNQIQEVSLVERGFFRLVARNQQ